MTRNLYKFASKPTPQKRQGRVTRGSKSDVTLCHLPPHVQMSVTMTRRHQRDSAKHKACSTSSWRRWAGAGPSLLGVSAPAVGGQTHRPLGRWSRCWEAPPSTHTENSSRSTCGDAHNLSFKTKTVPRQPSPQGCGPGAQPGKAWKHCLGNGNVTWRTWLWEDDGCRREVSTLQLVRWFLSALGSPSELAQGAETPPDLEGDTEMSGLLPREYFSPWEAGGGLSSEQSLEDGAPSPPKRNRVSRRRLFPPPSAPPPPTLNGRSVLWAHGLLPCPASRGSATVHTPTVPPTWAAGRRSPCSTAPAGLRRSWGCAQNTRSTPSRRHVRCSLWALQNHPPWSSRKGRLMPSPPWPRVPRQSKATSPDRKAPVSPSPGARTRSLQTEPTVLPSPSSFLAVFSQGGGGSYPACTCRPACAAH
ncbi:PREDICTED: uncharacterized protein LOC102255441 [Myotis brandtii]|uniref:uncharacterized protein LOC102255441 n=1 Tax=Myotis brandtii TaxID=109478 RepID=UPI0003BB6F12|nr:PREDICTED: uncharacterized protein LOC102255441 [Myotis brandtii]